MPKLELWHEKSCPLEVIGVEINRMTKLKEMIFSTLRSYKCNDTKTSCFKELKHNANLVPKFTENLNYLVDCFKSYGNACYDIQGVRDSGVDVLIKYTEESETHYIGVQIKSYDDIKDKDWLTKLKAQIFEAQGAWKLDDFYVAFCTDADEHKDKLRNASADIIKLGGDKFHIIEPSYALGFFQLNSLDIIIKTHNFFRADDPILENAKKDLIEFNLLEAAVIIDAAVSFHTNSYSDMEPETLFESFLPASIFQKYYNVSNKFFDLNEIDMKNYNIGDDIHEGDCWMKLYDSRFFHQSRYENTKFYPEGSWDLSALILDAKARHNLDLDDLKEYILNLLLIDKIKVAKEYLIRRDY